MVVATRLAATTSFALRTIRYLPPKSDHSPRDTTIALNLGGIPACQQETEPSALQEEGLIAIKLFQPRSQQPKPRLRRESVILASSRSFV